MKAIAKSAVIGGASALFLAANIALSSAGVSLAGTIPNGHGDPSHKKAGCDTSGYCLTESNTGSGGGILAESKDLYGLLGISSATGGDGVYGEDTGSAGNGVAGIGGQSGAGVSGSDTSTDGVGVYGTGATYGVEGNSSSTLGAGVYGNGSGSETYGVYGYASSAPGVYGYSNSAEGGYFENNNSSYYTLLAYNGVKGGYPFAAEAASGQFYVDGNGDGYFTGYVTALGGYQTVIRSRDGQNLGASVALTPQATMEDTGTARLVDGEGVVRFASDFASTIDAARGYQVFLTPKGETRGWLYVAAEYEGGFIVREGLRGRSSVYFDYRIVAHPHGLSDARLPQVNIKLPIIPPAPKLPLTPKLPQIQRPIP